MPGGHGLTVPPRRAHGACRGSSRANGAGWTGRLEHGVTRTLGARGRHRSDGLPW
ncbi:Hypothetical protein A7982_07248 [Minicystis rosea]|nr:Hypothetical protein A7982_07248 [Minicystis rosea]